MVTFDDVMVTFGDVMVTFGDVRADMIIVKTFTHFGPVIFYLNVRNSLAS